MRQKRREIEDREQIEKLLCTCTTVQLGLWDGEEPYVVTVNFGYAQGALYFHGALQGRKMDCIRRNGLVSFATVVESELIREPTACGYSTYYTSITGFGRARELKSEEEKVAALDVLLGQHGGPTGAYDPKVLSRTAVVRVQLERLVGKVNPAFPGDPQI